MLDKVYKINSKDICSHSLQLPLSLCLVSTAWWMTCYVAEPMYNCMHPHSLAVFLAVALFFSIVVQRAAHVVVPNAWAFHACISHHSHCDCLFCKAAHPNSYFHTSVLILCWNQMLCFWATGGSGGTGCPLAHSLSPRADGSGWAELCEWAPFVSGCSVAAYPRWLLYLLCLSWLAESETGCAVCSGGW